MTTKPVELIVIGACVLFANSLLAADYDDGRGKLWRQPAQVMGMTWNQVQAVCPTDGVSSCGGSLQGWTWATQQQTIDLFNGFLPPTHQLTVENPGMEAYVNSPFAYTTVFAMNGAPYSFFYAVRGWTSTLDSQGKGIRGTISEGGGPVSFYASIGVNDPFSVSQSPGYLNETGIWLWKGTQVWQADANHDLNVDTADYVAWRKLDDEDPSYSTWRENYGEPVGGGASPSPTPEPHSMIPLLTALYAMLPARGTFHGRSRRPGAA